jgi:hypothetical protein
VHDWTLIDEPSADVDPSVDVDPSAPPDPLSRSGRRIDGASVGVALEHAPTAIAKIADARRTRTTPSMMQV